MPIKLLLKDVRQQAGVSQVKLGQALGMEQAAISRLERRKALRRLDVALLERIARVLKVKLADLLEIE